MKDLVRRRVSQFEDDQLIGITALVDELAESEMPVRVHLGLLPKLDYHIQDRRRHRTEICGRS